MKKIIKMSKSKLLFGIIAVVVMFNMTKFEIPEFNINQIKQDNTTTDIADNNITASELLEASTNEEGYERYSNLDSLNRPQEALAKITPDTLSSEERESISNYKPVGWHTYNTKNTWNMTLEDNTFYLYNRCHLIAHCLTGANAIPSGVEGKALNLITGTREMNLKMEVYEIQIANYVRDTGESVLYKVTPIYEGDNLLASSVHIEAVSLNSTGLEINDTISNTQQGFEINYKDGTATYLGGK